jgi:hypothetical protein
MNKDKLVNLNQVKFEARFCFDLSTFETQYGLRNLFCVGEKIKTSAIICIFYSKEL